MDLTLASQTVVTSQPPQPLPNNAGQVLPPPAHTGQAVPHTSFMTQGNYSPTGSMAMNMQGNYAPTGGFNMPPRAPQLGPYVPLLPQQISTPPEILAHKNLQALMADAQALATNQPDEVQNAAHEKGFRLSNMFRETSKCLTAQPPPITAQPPPS